MAHSRQWDTTDPADTGDAGDGALELRNAKEDFLERFTLDHYIADSPSGVTDTSLADADGYHRKVTLKSLSVEPTPLSGAGVIYTKTVSGVVSPYYRNSEGTFLLTNREAYYYSAARTTDGYFTWNTALSDTIGTSLSTDTITLPLGTYVIEMLPAAGYGVSASYSFYDTDTSTTTAFSGLFYHVTQSSDINFKVYVDLAGGSVVGSMRIKRI